MAISEVTTERFVSKSDLTTLYKIALSFKRFLLAIQYYDRELEGMKNNGMNWMKRRCERSRFCSTDDKTKTYSSRLRQVLLAGTGPTGAVTHKIEKGYFHEQAKFQLRLA
jgi:hypothetical protein